MMVVDRCWLSVAQDIVPDVDGTRDLGSATKKWRDLYVSGSSIVLAQQHLQLMEQEILQLLQQDSLRSSSHSSGNYKYFCNIYCRWSE